jgi:multiple sugar transport system substrate-binding protein
MPTTWTSCAETVARVVPTINYPGATAFNNALDENLMASLTKAKTPEQAMADTEREWKRIARRIGENKILEAIKANKAAWPSVLDPVSG